MRSRALLVSSLLVSLLAVAPLHAATQSMGQWRSHARGQVEQIWRQLKAEFGFGYMGEMVVGSLEQGDDEYFEVEFLGHREYVIVGICDADCHDMDLLLYDRNDNVVLEDVLTDDEPVIRVPAGYGGTHYVEAVMPGCNVEPCFYAVQIFQRYPGS